MENEHGKNLAVLFDCELKASTSSQDLLCKQKHSEDDTSAETQDESESFSDIDDEEVTNKYTVLSVTCLSKYASTF
jgi:hypothetical protein